MILSVCISILQSGPPPKLINQPITFLNIWSWLCSFISQSNRGLDCKTTSANEWVASNRILCCTQRVLGSPGGKHRKSLEGNVRCEGSVKLFFFLKNFDFGKRIPLFRRFFFFFFFIRHGVEQSWYVETVSFSLNDVIKFIDKLCYLRKVDYEIYIELWSRNSTDLGVNLREMTQQSLLSCHYLCRDCFLLSCVC